MASCQKQGTLGISALPGVTGHNRKRKEGDEYSHRVEEVGTSLTALEGLQGSGETRGGG